MERFTKIIVTLWVCAAIVLQAWLLRGWPDLLWYTLAAFVLTLALSRFDRRVVMFVLPFAYLFPALLKLLHGNSFALFEVMWMGALAGVIAPDALRSRWHIPARWRGALVLACLITVTSATLITWREIDGQVTLLSAFESTYWRAGEPPPFQVQWILNVALILLLGVLWFDWLCGHPELDFERVVAMPLMLSVSILAAVSAYQTFVDIRFLNETVFGNIHRASATMYDANVAGAIAAFWVAGAFVWALRLRGRYVYAGAAVMLACILAVWASGSRTAVLAGTVAIAGAVVSLVLAGRRRIGRWSIAAGVGLVAAIVAVVAAIGKADPLALNPAARIWYTLISFPSPAAFFAEMWNRNGYGRSAMVLIERYPWFGSGIGNFNQAVVVVSHELGYWTPPDNAQNWLRHQVVEFGLIGALPWAIWMCAFAWFVLIPKRQEPRSIWALRGVLLAFGFISLFGMPGQDLMVAITFWSLAVWYARLAGMPADRPLHRLTWVAMVVVVAAFSIGTVSTSARTLRLSERARAERRPFSYGFSPPDAAAQDFRKMTPHAETLLDPADRWIAVVVKLEQPREQAVDVRVWCDGDLVVKASLKDGTPVEGFVPLKTGSRALLEANAVPSGLAGWWPFTTRTGVLIRWDFVGEPPVGFTGYRTSAAGAKP